MKPIRIEAKIRNNILYHCIFDNYGSVNEFCIKNDFCPSSVGFLLNLKTKPKCKWYPDKYRKLCVDLSKLFKLIPEILFPDELYYNLKKTKTSVELSYEQLPNFNKEDVLLLEANHNPESKTIKSEIAIGLFEVFKTLTAREQQVIKARLGLYGAEGEKTLEQVAFDLKITRERVRQVEGRAIRRLQHPSRLKKLRDFVEGL